MESAPHTVFIVSPANLGGERARLLFRDGAASALARQVRTPEGAPLLDVFSFISSLYFRGKVAYAAAFGRPPSGVDGTLVITPGEGLVPASEPLTIARMRLWAEVEVDHRNDSFTRPLVEAVEALERAHGATTRFVLLGSVATNKYVRPLTRVFGDHLLFPTEFAGLGDMSRGALLLRAVRDRTELTYAPVETAQRTTAAVRLRRGRSG
jgi:hypothetical protein